MYNDDGDDISEEFNCPKCKSSITVELTCPTYLVNGRRMRCFPACGNATRYDCTDWKVCGWFYIDGIGEGDPGYKKSVANGKPAPIA